MNDEWVLVFEAVVLEPTPSLSPESALWCGIDRKSVASIAAVGRAKEAAEASESVRQADGRRRQKRTRDCRRESKSGALERRMHPVWTFTAFKHKREQEAAVCTTRGHKERPKRGLLDRTGISSSFFRTDFVRTNNSEWTLGRDVK